MRDPGTFATFIDAIAAGGQAKLTRVDAASPLGKLGVVATANPSAEAVAIIRVRGSDAVLDLVDAVAGKKPPSPAELARRFPLVPARPFAVEHGARRLFAPEAAAVAYVDGRHLAAFLQAKAADDQRSRAALGAAVGEGGGAGALAHAREEVRDLDARAVDVRRRRRWR